MGQLACTEDVCTGASPAALRQCHQRCVVPRRPTNCASHFSSQTNGVGTVLLPRRWMMVSLACHDGEEERKADARVAASAVMAESIQPPLHWHGSQRQPRRRSLSQHSESHSAPLLFWHGSIEASCTRREEQEQEQEEEQEEEIEMERNHTADDADADTDELELSAIQIERHSGGGSSLALGDTPHSTAAAAAASSSSSAIVAPASAHHSSTVIRHTSTLNLSSAALCMRTPSASDAAAPTQQPLASPSLLQLNALPPLPTAVSTAASAAAAVAASSNPAAAAAAAAAPEWVSELHAQWEVGAVAAEQARATQKAQRVRQQQQREVERKHMQRVGPALSPAVQARPPLSGDIEWKNQPRQRVTVSRRDGGSLASLRPPHGQPLIAPFSHFGRFASLSLCSGRRVRVFPSFVEDLLAARASSHAPDRLDGEARGGALFGHLGLQRHGRQEPPQQLPSLEHPRLQRTNQGQEPKQRKQIKAQKRGANESCQPSRAELTRPSTLCAAMRVSRCAAGFHRAKVHRQSRQRPHRPLCHSFHHGRVRDSLHAQVEKGACARVWRTKGMG